MSFKNYRTERRKCVAHQHVWTINESLSADPHLATPQERRYIANRYKQPQSDVVGESRAPEVCLNQSWRWALWTSYVIVRRRKVWNHASETYLERLLYTLKEDRGYRKLRHVTLDSTLLRTRCGRSYGPVVRQTAGWMIDGVDSRSVPLAVRISFIVYSDLDVFFSALHGSAHVYKTSQHWLCISLRTTLVI